MEKNISLNSFLDSLLKESKLPGDDEIANETHRAKLALAKKGKPGNKCSEERKQKIGKKNSVSRMSDYQRQQLIKSNKENPRHTTTHSEETKAKIRKVLASKPDIVCPHCGHTSRSGVIYRWHFENCRFK